MSITHKNFNSKNYEGFTIYKLTNPVGGFYIGATTNFERRKTDYQSGGRTSKQKHIYQSIQKWGFSAHTLEILYEWDKPFNLNFYTATEMKYIQDHYYKNPNKSLNIIITGVSKSETQKLKDGSI